MDKISVQKPLRWNNKVLTFDPSVEKEIIETAIEYRIYWNHL